MVLSVTIYDVFYRENKSRYLVILRPPGYQFESSLIRTEPSSVAKKPSPLLQIQEFRRSARAYLVAYHEATVHLAFVCAPINTNLLADRTKNILHYTLQNVTSPARRPRKLGTIL